MIITDTRELRRYVELKCRVLESPVCEECGGKIWRLEDAWLYESDIRPDRPLLLHKEHCTSETFLRSTYDRIESPKESVTA